MEIKDMLDREDFPVLLKDTIEDYFLCVFNKKIVFSYEEFENSERIVINKLLSFVTKTKAPHSLWGHLNSEYNVRGNVLKYLLAKAAIVAVCSNTAIGKLKYAYVTKGCLGDNVVISPQNRSIRVFDYDNNYVDSIIKKGFTSKYFRAQLDFRRTHTYHFLNPLLDFGDNWFREPILKGHPLVRETNQDRFKKAYAEALRYIEAVTHDTLEYTNGKEYVNFLLDDFENKLNLALRTKHIDTYVSSKALINKLQSKLSVICSELPVCLSHGDLQSGNVWVNPDGSCLIYDWETVGRRSIWYDRATFEFELRRNWGWSNFWQAANICKINTKDILFDSIITPESIKCLVLLEDLHFYIDDMLELPNDWGKQDYDEFIDRTNSFIQYAQS